MQKLRAAVIGVGYLGNFHVQKYLPLDNIDFVAVVDTNEARAREVAGKYGVRAVSDYRSLLGELDLVSIVVPPANHFEIARACLEAGVHILVEKPVTETVEQAEVLIELASRRGLVFQVGHLERFNPAVLALRDHLSSPYLIEAQRFAEYKPRGTEVDVVLDLMIHDIDIVLSIVESDIAGTRSSGTTVVTGDIDIAHARLQFENGCIAELTASRVSREQVRTMSVHQPNSYISIDYLNHSLLVGRIDPDGRTDEHREVSFETHSLVGTDVLMDEITSFVEAVARGSRPEVTGEDGKRALEVAVEISRRINRHRAGRSITTGTLS
jgi:predicted dehydrogenase